MSSAELDAAVVREPHGVVSGRVTAAVRDDLPDDLEVAGAARAGQLHRVAPGIVLMPGTDAGAVDELRALPQPFTISEARSRLATSRRVALPLLEHLDRARLTRRLPDDRRVVQPE